MKESGKVDQQYSLLQEKYFYFAQHAAQMYTGRL